MDFSVIIPAFNCEKTIIQTIDSIESVQIDKMEIILVDDGSTDCTSEVCKKIIDKYSNVNYYYQNNAGVSVARNNGLKHAKGEYVLFWDSDDSANSNLLKQCMLTAKNNDVDLLIFGMKQKRTYKQKSLYVELFQCKKEELLLQLDFEKRLAGLFDINYLSSSCNKVFKRTLCQRISFNTSKRVFEDLLFVLEYLKYCKRIIVLPHIAYIYSVDLSVNRASRYKYVIDFEEYMKEFQCAVIDLETELGTELPDLRNRIKRVYEWILQDKLFYCTFSELKELDPRRLRVTLFGEEYKPYSLYSRLFFANKLLSLRMHCLYYSVLNSMKRIRKRNNCSTD